jgi:guanine deaminase
MSFTNQEKFGDSPRRWALRGDLLDFSAAPRWGEIDSPAVRFDRDHWLLIEDGRIVGRQAEAPDDSWARKDHAGQLVLPGFIDTHVHCPQLEVIGSYGTELLDWLKRYTFPSECAFADPARSRAGAEVFLDALLANGTTSAVVFPTVHKVSAEALFDSAGLRDDVAQAEKDCIDLISRFHGRDRLAYAVTVRFAPTSTPEQLAMAGALCRADASLYMQTHVAENRAEVAWVGELFPQARSYLDVYDAVGLVHPRSVLAHGIYLDPRDRVVVADRGAQIAHCPSSNLFLGSGLFDWRDAAFNISLASDVGGGTSLNLQRNMQDAYKIQALRGERLTAWAALHAATRGAAEALQLGDEIGGLSVGQTADICVWDWAAGPVAEARDAVARELHERVFAWMTLADERNLAACYVAGRPRV